MTVKRIAAVAILTVTGWFDSNAQEASGEYQLKAVFLYNFAHFVEWPGKLTRNESFVIGVVGENHFGSALEETIRGEAVHGRPIEIKYFKSHAELEPCHILFVSRSQKEHLKQILDKAGKYTLTVSDVDSFNDFGGMIRFYNRQNKIRLSINKKALDSTRLVVSSKLLRLGEIKE